MWRLTPYVVSADGVGVGNGLPAACDCVDSSQGRGGEAEFLQAMAQRGHRQS